MSGRTLKLPPPPSFEAGTEVTPDYLASQGYQHTSTNIKDGVTTYTFTHPNGDPVSISEAGSGSSAGPSYPSAPPQSISEDVSPTSPAGMLQQYETLVRATIGNPEGAKKVSDHLKKHMSSFSEDQKTEFFDYIKSTTVQGDFYNNLYGAIM